MPGGLGGGRRVITGAGTADWANHLSSSVVPRDDMYMFPHQMNKGSGGGAVPGSLGAKWQNTRRTTYMCADGAVVPVPNMAFYQYRHIFVSMGVTTVCLNMVSYEGRSGEAQLFVSGTQFSRAMSAVEEGAWAGSVTFPGTVRSVSDSAFWKARLKSVVLNEGLEALGKFQNAFQDGVFSKTHLKRVRLPSTLLMLGCHTFA